MEADRRRQRLVKVREEKQTERERRGEIEHEIYKEREIGSLG